MDSFVALGDETVKNTIGNMEHIEVKKETDSIASDFVKHEPLADEIKYEICTDMDGVNSSHDIKLSEKILNRPILENDETNQDDLKNLNKCETVDHIYDNEGPYEMCEQKFIEKLPVHKQTHTQAEEKTHECLVCKKTFRLRSHLKLHQRIHTGKYQANVKYAKRCYAESTSFTQTGEKVFECIICEKKFNQGSTLIAHIRIHTGEKPFECNMCEKRFSQSGDLITHKRIHSKEKPFECDICEKKFNHSSHLVVHKRTHTGERPYECNVCEKRFMQSSNLIAHKRIHTGEKPFECNMCEKKFNHNSTLMRHKRIHTGEKSFECDTCKKRFNRSTDLIVHKRVHTGEKPFQCNACEKKFSQSSTLIAHKRIHTRENI